MFLPPRQIPAGTVKATAQESEEDDNTRPPGLLGTEKHVLPLCWTLFVVEPLKTEEKRTLAIRGGGEYCQTLLFIRAPQI